MDVFASDLASVADTRRFVAAELRSWNWSAALVDDVVLVASELATNAILHARPMPFEVSIAELPTGVHLEVADASTEVPSVQFDRSDPGGYGLRIVQDLAGRWGVSIHPTGKVVWADFSEGA